MSLSDRERRALTEMESDFAADGGLRSSRCFLVAAGIGIGLAAVAAVVTASALGLAASAAATLTLVVGLTLGLAASALVHRWRLVKLGVRWGPPRIPRRLAFLRRGRRRHR